MNKLYDVCGMGNGVVDVLLQISEQEFQTLDLEKGTMRLVESKVQKELLTALAAHKPTLASGGSVANSIVAVAQLGGKGAFFCRLGDDRYGLFYEEEFSTFGIETRNPITVGEMTGTSVIVITPDAERTMRTDLGIGMHLGPENIDQEALKRSKWLFIEGYLFSNTDSAREAIKRGIAYAKAAQCKIAITFSEAFIVEVYQDIVREALKHADLVFANEKEACAYTGKSNWKDAFGALTKEVSGVVVTAGPAGALVHYDGADFKVEAYKCQPKDLTGAGDMFAGAFLYGITNGFEPKDAAQRACYLAKQVISQVGPRLHSGVKEYWVEALNRRP